MSAAGIVLTIIVVLALVVIAWLLAWWLYERASKELSFVRTGLGGQKVVMNGGAFVLPVLHTTTRVNMNTTRLEVVRAAEQSLITRDRMRVDVDAEFYVRVQPTPDSIAMAAQTLGGRTMRPEALKELLEGRFIDALRAIAAELTMEDIHEQRADFVRRVREKLAGDLLKSGLELESASLTGLDQTDRQYFNPSNAFDAAGLTKLTGEIEDRRRRRNEIEQDSEVAIQEKNLEAEKRKLDIARQEEDARLAQQQQIAVQRARQRSDVAKEEVEREHDIELAKTDTNERIELARLAAERIVEEARINTDQGVRERDIARDTTVELAKFERDMTVAEKSKEASRAQAEAEEVRGLLVKAEEAVATVRDVERAERDKSIELVDARKKAESKAIDVVVTAEARHQASQEAAAARRIETESDVGHIRAMADADAAAEVARSEAAARRYEVDAAGQRAMHEADRALSTELIDLKVKMAVIEHIRDIIAESVKPLERIEGIKVVSVEGLTPSGGGGPVGGEPGASPQNLAEQIVSGALRYRAHAPIIDALLKEIGLSGVNADAVVDALKSLSDGNGDN